MPSPYRPLYQVQTSPSNFAVASGISPFILNAGDAGYIQNLGTNALYVKRGTGCLTTSFSYLLQAGSAQDDGSGGALVIDDFVGAVTVTGTSPRYIAWKR